MKILITGGSGLVGSTFSKYNNCILMSSKDCNLLNRNEFDLLVKDINPDAIVHLAAKVGGVKGNMNDQYSFFYDNLNINNNVLNVAYGNKVKYVISMLSTCIYPANKFPYKEENLHEGEPHNSNFGYAYSKRMLEVATRIFREQFGQKYICVVPNNIFGENDNFDLENGHVIPSMIRKIYEGKLYNKKVILWGNGKPLREFTYSHDISKTIIRILDKMEKDNMIKFPILNIGNSKEYSIEEVAIKICNIFDYDFNMIIWNRDEPMGVFKKPSDNSKFKQNFLEDKERQTWYTNFDYALYSTCKWFEQNYPNVRGIK